MEGAQRTAAVAMTVELEQTVPCDHRPREQVGALVGRSQEATHTHAHEAVPSVRYWHLFNTACSGFRLQSDLSL